MKRRLIYLFAPAWLLAAGCSEEHPADAQEGLGTLQIACTADGGLAVRAALPQAADFALELSDGTATRRWASVAEFNAENPLLVQGEYTAAIAFGDPEAEGSDKPCYAGSERFELKARRQNRVEITARIANAQALVRTTERFRTYFHEAAFAVATGAGNRFEYRFAPEGDAANEAVWVRAASTLSVSGTAVRQAGDEVAFAEQTVDATRPATRYIFEYDAPNAGSAVVNIWIDDELTATVPVEVELNEDAR